MIEITIMWAGIFLILLWASICNDKTRRQRHELINAAARDGSSLIKQGLDWKIAWIPYERVSYEAHFWRLLTFRDPNKLYNAVVEGPKE